MKPSFIYRKYYVLILFGLLFSTVGFSNITHLNDEFRESSICQNTPSQVCGNTIALLPEAKGLDNKSIFVKVSTSNQYVCILYKYKNGEYVELEREDGYGNNTVQFSELTEGELYKVRAEFESDNWMCKFKEISAIRL
ncbi:MAG: hypothetical protein OEX22_05320 [Cyclobacteriaceae bacterium]|nr:hypothetical protein [Cyclobacteriaceae bacterium]